MYSIHHFFLVTITFSSCITTAMTQELSKPKELSKQLSTALADLSITPANSSITDYHLLLPKASEVTIQINNSPTITPQINPTFANNVPISMAQAQQQESRTDNQLSASSSSDASSRSDNTNSNNSTNNNFSSNNNQNKADNTNNNSNNNISNNANNNANQNDNRNDNKNANNNNNENLNTNTNKTLVWNKLSSTVSSVIENPRGSFYLFGNEMYSSIHSLTITNPRRFFGICALSTWCYLINKVRKTTKLMKKKSSWCRWNPGLRYSELVTIPAEKLCDDLFFEIARRYCTQRNMPELSPALKSFLKSIDEECKMLSDFLLMASYLKWGLKWPFFITRYKVNRAKLMLRRGRFLKNAILSRIAYLTYHHVVPYTTPPVTR
jgi:hypothetical protein